MHAARSAPRVFCARATWPALPAHARRAPQFKLQCRLLGLPRWPYRKLRSLKVLENHLQEHVERERLPDGSVPESLREWSLRVKEVRARAPRRARARARALTRSADAPPALQDEITENPTRISGKKIADMLQQLESVRQWDVKFHYNNRKRAGNNAAAVAQQAQPRPVPQAPKATGDRARMQAVARARVARGAAAGRRKAAEHLA